MENEKGVVYHWIQINTLNKLYSYNTTIVIVLTIFVIKKKEFYLNKTVANRWVAANT